MVNRLVSGHEVGYWTAIHSGGGIYAPELSWAVGLKNDISNKYVAGVIFERYNGVTASVHIASCGRRWMTRKFLWSCFSYAFEGLRVRKLLGFVSSKNANAIRFCEHLGFRHEATVSDGMPDGDLIIMTMTEDECPWLKLGDRYGFKLQNSRPS